MRRRPEISLRTPQALGHDRAVITEERIIARFRDMLSFCKKNAEQPTSDSKLRRIRISTTDADRENEMMVFYASFVHIV